MRRLMHALIGSAVLLGFATGCVNRSQTATIVGRVGTSGDRDVTQSVRFSQPHSLSLSGDQPLPGAEIAIVVTNPDGDRVLASTKSDPNGDFTLDYPSDLPEGAALVVTAPGHEPYREDLYGRQPGYQQMGIALKKLKKV
jgi:hypothetical protein